MLYRWPRRSAIHLHQWILIDQCLRLWSIARAEDLCQGEHQTAAGEAGAAGNDLRSHWGDIVAGAWIDHTC